MLLLVALNFPPQAHHPLLAWLHWQNMLNTLFILTAYLRETTVKTVEIAQRLGSLVLIMPLASHVI